GLLLAQREWVPALTRTRWRREFGKPTYGDARRLGPPDVGHEAPRVHHAAGRRCGRLAARGARTTAAAGDWVSPYRLTRSIRPCDSGLPPGGGGIWFCRKTRH